MDPTPEHRLPFKRESSPAALEAARQSVASLKQAIAQRRSTLDSTATLIAWISDLHLHARRPYQKLSDMYCTEVDCSDQLEIALAEIRELGPDLLVFGGDLADSGCPHQAPADEYDELGKLLQAHLPAELPSLAICGNHDHGDKPLTAAWHEAFQRNAPADWPESVEEADYYFETSLGPWRIIGLDTRQSQRLSDSQRTWLAERLPPGDTRPTILLMHRPFVSVGNWVDDHRLHDRPTLAIIQQAPGVRLLLSGHTHRSAAWLYGGQTHVVFPASAYGIGAPIGWGATLLSAGDVAGTYTKELATASYCDNVNLQTLPATGEWHELEVVPFVTSPLFNPCKLPRC